MTACVECGADLSGVATCRMLFDELLALEWRVEGGPGTLVHFLAIASYNLQHPSEFTPDALRGLRRALHDALSGQATIDGLLRRARALTEGATRVRRRDDTPLTDDDRAMLDAWPTRWPMTVADVCRATPDVYQERVNAWAAAVSDALR